MADLCGDLLEVACATVESNLCQPPPILAKRCEQLATLAASWSVEAAAELIGPNLIADIPQAVLRRQLKKFHDLRSEVSFRYIAGNSGEYLVSGRPIATISLEPVEPFRLQEFKFNEAQSQR